MPSKMLGRAISVGSVLFICGLTGCKGNADDLLSAYRPAYTGSEAAEGVVDMGGRPGSGGTSTATISDQTPPTADSLARGGALSQGGAQTSAGMDAMVSAGRIAPSEGGSEVGGDIGAANGGDGGSQIDLGGADNDNGGQELPGGVDHVHSFEDLFGTMPMAGENVPSGGSTGGVHGGGIPEESGLMGGAVVGGSDNALSTGGAVSTTMGGRSGDHGGAVQTLGGHSAGRETIDPVIDDCAGGCTPQFCLDGGCIDQNPAVFVMDELMDDASAGVQPPRSVAMHGGRALVAFPGSPGTVLVLERTALGTWTQADRLSPGNQEATSPECASFGTAVALGDDIAFVGCDSEPNDDRAGSVYVFERDATAAWTEVARLAPDLAANASTFGHALAFGPSIDIEPGDLQDQAVLFVGAPQADAGSGHGRVHVCLKNYYADASGWACLDDQQLYAETAVAADSSQSDGFGTHIALNADTIAISAPDAGTGTIYVFQVRNRARGVGDNAFFLPVDMIFGPCEDDPAVAPCSAGERILGNIAISDAHLFVSGQNFDEQGTTGPGFVSIFAREGQNGPTFGPSSAQQTYDSWGLPVGRLMPPDDLTGSSSDEQRLRQRRFGQSLAVAGDRILVENPSGSRHQLNPTGNVIIYQHDENGAHGSWTEIVSLGPQSEEGTIEFGSLLAAHGDFAVVLAPGEASAYFLAGYDRFSSIVGFEDCGVQGSHCHCRLANRGALCAASGNSVPEGHGEGAGGVEFNDDEGQHQGGAGGIESTEPDSAGQQNQDDHSIECSYGQGACHNVKGLVFEGSDDSLYIDDPAVLRGFVLGSSTLDFWIRMPSGSTGGQVLKAGDDNRYLLLELQGDGYVVFKAINGAQFMTVSSGPLTRDRWFHIAVVRAATVDSTELEIFVDGQSMGTQQAAFNEFTLTNGSLMTIGAQGVNTVDFHLARMRFWDVALSGPEMVVISNSDATCPLQAPAAQPAYFFPLDEASGTEVADVLGSGIVASLSLDVGRTADPYCGRPDNPTEHANGMACTGGIYCNDVCVDFQTDDAHCGVCDNHCGENGFCVAGECHTCSDGKSLCAGACVDLTNNDGNCGGCNTACDAGQSCVNGACIAPVSIVQVAGMAPINRSGPGDLAVNGELGAVATPGRGSGETAGGAMILESANGGWVANLAVSDACDFTQDRDVSVAFDGDQLALGCWPLEDLSTANGSGHIYAGAPIGIDAPFGTPRSTTTADSSLNVSNGYAHALLQDGRVLMSAPFPRPGTGQNGMVYVCRPTNSGMFGGFACEETIQAPSVENTAINYFGYTLAVGDDFLVVGALGDPSAGYAENGVYIFRANESGDGPSYSYVQTINEITAAVQGARFGFSVAIAGDQILIGVKVPGQDATFQGEVWRFDRVRTIGGPDSWTRNRETTLIVPDAIIPGNDSPIFDFGHSLAVGPTGEVLLVGNPGGRNENGDATGNVVLYDFDAGEDTWEQRAILTPAEAEGRSGFGASVATDGTTAMIALPASSLGADDGAVYVLNDVQTLSALNMDDPCRADPESCYCPLGAQASQCQWVEPTCVYPTTGIPIRYPKAITDSATDGRGESVALAEQTLVVGRKNATVEYNDGSGPADYGFAGKADVMELVEEGGDVVESRSDSIQATRPNGDNRFGTVVGIDNDVVYVSEPRASLGANTFGRLHLFGLNDEGPSLIKEPIVVEGYSIAPQQDVFERVAMDGDLLVVGNPSFRWLDGDLSADLAGAAYSATRTGDQWSSSSLPYPFDESTGRFAGERFGDVVAAGDGLIAVASSGGETHGRVAVYERDETSEWRSIWTWAAPVRSNDSHLGPAITALAISESTLMVGIPRYDGVEAQMNRQIGAVFVFRRNEETGEFTTDPQVLLSGAATHDGRFGHSIALSGALAVIGEPGGFDATSDEAPGSAWIFARDEVGTWGHVAQLLANDPSRLNGGAQESLHPFGFGESVTTNGDWVVIGALAPESNEGRVYGMSLCSQFSLSSRNPIHCLCSQSAP